MTRIGKLANELLEFELVEINDFADFMLYGDLMKEGYSKSEIKESISLARFILINE